MRILMLGNSFTSYNDMLDMLAELLEAEVVHHIRGGARLAEQLNPKTEMGAKTLAAFYRWVFGWGCMIRIEGPEEIRAEY